MELRRAKTDDIDGMIRLLYQVNQVHADGRPDLFKSGGIKYTKDSLALKINDPSEDIFVAVENDEVLAYCFGVTEIIEENTSQYPKKSFYIDDLCVDESKRGQHIATKLYAYVKDYVKSSGYDRITLHVWECNPNAKAFYQAMGMQQLVITMEDTLA